LLLRAVVFVWGLRAAALVFAAGFLVKVCFFAARLVRVAVCFLALFFVAMESRG
jgi:hypothetical protein